jgi:hypothetical protein
MNEIYKSRFEKDIAIPLPIIVVESSNLRVGKRVFFWEGA